MQYSTLIKDKANHTEIDFPIFREKIQEFAQAISDVICSERLEKLLQLCKHKSDNVIHGAPSEGISAIIALKEKLQKGYQVINKLKVGGNDAEDVKKALALEIDFSADQAFFWHYHKEVVSLIRSFSDLLNEWRNPTAEDLEYVKQSNKAIEILTRAIQSAPSLKLDLVMPVLRGDTTSRIPFRHQNAMKSLDNVHNNLKERLDKLKGLFDTLGSEFNQQQYKKFIENIKALSELAVADHSIE